MDIILYTSYTYIYIAIIGSTGVNQFYPVEYTGTLGMRIDF